MESPEEFARKQVLAKPYLANAASINLKKCKQDQRLARCSGRTTYIRTREDWLYLAIVVDLFSRQVVVWSIGSRIDTSAVLDAMLMALWRRQPHAPVMVHSEQGCHFPGHEWQTLLRDHTLASSMSRLRNCHCKAVAESFFQPLKRKRIRRRLYDTRGDARAGVFNYIDNSQRRHSSAAGLSSVEPDQRPSKKLKSV